MKIQTFDESIKKYSGRNGFSEITNLDPTQFRAASNIDLYSGAQYDYFRVRRGSTRLVPDADPQRQLGQILNKVVFPINEEEYLICAYIPDPESPKVAFSSQPLLSTGNPTRIGGTTWAISGSTFLSKLVLFGVTLENSDGLKLYFQYEPPDTNTLHIYADADLTDWVATVSGLVADQTNLILEENDSGISGTVYVGTPGDEEESGTFDLETVELDYSVKLIPDMKVFNNRVYVFQQKGNKVIEWNSVQERMAIRDMGLPLPSILGWSSNDDIGDGGTIDKNGSYYYGLELVVQKDGVDLAASTPNRKYADGSIQQVFPLAGNSMLELDMDAIDATLNWTHIRLWRTKDLVPNFSDPLFPIDAQGVIDQLYEVALITRAEIYGTFGAIATGSELPPGNALVQAGFASTGYFINDKNGDDVLSFLVGIDLIELVPIPGCRTGDIVSGKVFCSGVGDDFLAPNGELIDPSIAEDVLYTTTPFSEYQEQWEPQAYLNAGRDGKKTTAIIAFLADVIVVREGMTKRIQQANPDAGIVMVDDKIGIPTFRMIGYIPGIGLCAICSDKYFRYLGFGLEWNQSLGGTEISQSIYDVTSASFDSGRADFAYMNGKLLMLVPLGNIAALHVKEGKGWTLYADSNGNWFWDVLFNFSNGQRAAVAIDNAYLLEIERDVDYDENAIADADPTDVIGSWESYGFSGKGKLIEAERFSFWGRLSGNATVTAKVSNNTWEMLPTFQDPGLFAANPDYNERQYRFEPEPSDVGVFKWVPLRGQFISFSVSTKAPAMVAWQKLEGKIRQTNGNQQASLAGGIAPQGPGWANQDLMLLNFEDPADVFYDASGKGLNHDWNGNPGPVAQGPSASHFTGITLFGWDNSTLYGARSSGSGHTWTLWLTAEERDAGNIENAVATCDTINLDGEQVLNDVNASGIYGVFTTENANGGSDDDLNIAYLPRAPKTNRVSQKPGKGVLVSGGGYLNYTPDPTTPLIGVKNLVWKAVFSFPEGGNFQSSGKVGGTAWKLYSDSTGVTFQLSSPSYTWTATVSLTALTVYALVFTLSKSLDGAVYVDGLDGEFSGKRTTVKTSGSNLDGFSEAVGDYSAHLSSLVLTGWDHDRLFGKYVPGGETAFWRLWRTPSERDAGSPSNSVAVSANLIDASTRAITQENGSGISGSVRGDGVYSPVEGNLDAVFIPGVLTGHNITPTGTVSYYEIEKSDPKVEQAKRFWGIMKAYP